MNQSRRVYSSDGGRIKPPGQDQGQKEAPSDGIVRVSRERAGRGGRTVTIVRGLPDRGQSLTTRVQELKQLCGAGGALKNGVVEIQGDHRERLAERLGALGYRGKLAGG